MGVASGIGRLSLVLALASAAGEVRAQEPEPAPGRDGARALVFREQLAPFAEQARRILGGDWERFRATLDALAAQEARQRGLVGDVDFSFGADETGDFGGGPGNETLFGLRAGARLGGGGYRSRIGLLGDMRALIHDNVFEQDFSRVRLGYDHQRTDHLGAFAFIERYSDDAMSIASRYEIGGGVSMGVDLWPRRDDEAGARALAPPRFRRRRRVPLRGRATPRRLRGRRGLAAAGLRPHGRGGRRLPGRRGRRRRQETPRRPVRADEQRRAPGTPRRP